MWKGFGRKRALTCQQVEARLMAYLKGGLCGARRGAIRDHLATCDACARSAREVKALEAELYAEAARHRPRLSPQTITHIQERVYRRMRRGLIMQRVTKYTGRVAGLVAILALAIGLFALWQKVKPVIEEISGQEENVVITFACESEATYLPLAERFHQDHPEITVQVLDMSRALGRKSGDPWPQDGYLRLAQAADTALIYIWPSAMYQGTLYDLTPFIKADPEGFDAADFYPGALESFRWNGRQWAIPAWVIFGVIHYNRQALAEAGLPEPQPGWSYQEFTDLAQALNQPGPEEKRHYGFANLWSNFTPALIAGMAGPLYEVMGDVVIPHLDRPQVADAVAWYAGLTDLMPPAYSQDWMTGLQTVVDLIMAGRVSLWAEWAGNIQGYPGQLDYGVAPFPSGQGPSTPLQVQAYTMSAGTRHPDAAWEWLNWLSHQPIPDYPGDPLPARRSLAATSAFWKRMEENHPDHLPAYRYALDHALPNQELSEITWALLSATNRVLEGTDPDSAVAQAQEQAAQGLGRRAEAGRTFDREIVVATPEPTPRPDKSVIRFFASSYDASELERLADQFQADHPDIVVKTSHGYAEPGELPTLADCFSYALLPPDESLLNLQPFIDADPTFPLDDFYAQYLEPFRHDGNLYALPAGIDPLVMRVNQNLLQAAGKSLPSPDWTWNDLVDLAQRLTTGRQWGYAPVYPFHLAVLLRARGVELIDLSTDPPQARFDDLAVEEGILWFVSSAGLGGTFPPEVSKAFRSGDYDSILSLARSDKVALWLDHCLPDYERARFQDVDLAMVPLPHEPGGYLDQFMGGYYISAETESPEACFQWITWLTGRPEVQESLASRRSVIESAEYETLVGKEAAAIYRAIATQEVAGSGWAQSIAARGLWPLLTWLSQSALVALEGGDLTAALADAQQKADTFLACMAIAPGSAENESIACAREADPSFSAQRP
jgi:ABC-type glycerol-3-phosphate transport system substrate-binding protein